MVYLFKQQSKTMERTFEAFSQKAINFSRASAGRLVAREDCLEIQWEIQKHIEPWGQQGGISCTLYYKKTSHGDGGIFKI